MNVFTQLQQDVIQRLTATIGNVPSLVPANGTITWITEDIGDLVNIVGRTVGKLGIVGIVMTPGGGTMYETTPSQTISFSCPIEIQLQENVTVNRGAAGTQIPVLDLVQFCMRRLHLWSPSNQRVNRVYLDETPYLLVAETPLLVYNVRFVSSLTVQ